MNHEDIGNYVYLEAQKEKRKKENFNTPEYREFLKREMIFFLDTKHVSDNPDDDKYLFEEFLTHLMEISKEGKEILKQSSQYETKASELKNSIKQTLDY